MDNVDLCGAANLQRSPLAATQQVRVKYNPLTIAQSAFIKAQQIILSDSKRPTTKLERAERGEFVNNELEKGSQGDDSSLCIHGVIEQ